MQNCENQNDKIRSQNDKIRNQKNRVRNQKKKYKTIIKQLQIDNVAFRKTFFVTTNKNKKNAKYSNSSKFKHNIDELFYEI